MIDHFGPLPVMGRGNRYVLLVTDLFSHEAAMYVVTNAQFIAVGTADIVVNEFIPKWGCTSSLLS